MYYFILNSFVIIYNYNNSFKKISNISILNIKYININIKIKLFYLLIKFLLNRDLFDYKMIMQSI